MTSAISQTMQLPDVEIGRLRDGYPALAKWIARDPDDDPLLFRRFGRHSARTLLYLQCQLIALENEIDDLDEQIRTAKDLDTRRSLQRWEKLMTSAEAEDSMEHKLVGKLEKFRIGLKEYYELLTLRSQVAQLNKPKPRVIAAYESYLNGTSLGGTKDNPKSIIFGSGGRFLQDPTDLVALQKPSEEDSLSRFLQKHWLFRKRDSTDVLDGTTLYKNSHIIRTVAVIDLVLASILLIGAVVSLYYVSSPRAKLALVAVYTLLFAMSVALCTNARKAEIFAATAAYAAVLVVFVSGDLGGAKTEQCLIQLEGGIFRVVNCPG